MLSFDHGMYVRLKNTSSKLAKQYRIDCWLEKPEQITEEPQIAVESNEFKVEYTREDFKSILEKWKIKYFKWATTQKLLELCTLNNLI